MHSKECKAKTQVRVISAILVDLAIIVASQIKSLRNNLRKFFSRFSAQFSVSKKYIVNHVMKTCFVFLYQNLGTLGFSPLPH